MQRGRLGGELELNKPRSEQAVEEVVGWGSYETSEEREYQIQYKDPGTWEKRGFHPRICPPISRDK